MDNIVKQDVFFFVTTIAVVVITVLVVILTAYIIKIVRDVKYIAGKAKKETDLLSEDLDEFRKNVKSEGSKLKAFAKLFSSFYKRRKK